MRNGSKEPLGFQSNYKFIRKYSTYYPSCGGD